MTELNGTSTLINLGNSCYMNVCIQALGHTLPLRDYFISKKYLETFTNKPASLKSSFVTNYYNLMNGLYGDNEDCIVQPISFRNTLIQCVDQFQGSRQEDAHECLIFMLQLLHDGLSVQVPYDVVSDDPMRNPTTAWVNFVKHEKSSNILQWFYGQYESMKKCLNCETTFPMYDAWNCLSLEIPLHQMKSQYQLSDLLDAHIEPETLEDKYSCENCENAHNAMSQHLIWKCPPILIIQLKRFQSTGGKVIVPIEYPLILDLSPYVSPNNREQSTVYDLYACIYHQGQLNGGHYYAACKASAPTVFGETTIRAPETNNWYILNDENVHSIEPDRVVTPFAYVLFYKKRFNDNEQKPPMW